MGRPRLGFPVHPSHRNGGHRHVPRGDLDRPIITGTVYNAINTPSYPIPGEVTRSGIRSRSTPGGDGYNEMSFEDAKGGEQIRVHAERDLDEDVLHDHTTRVGNDQSIHVAHDQSTLVDHDHTEEIRGNSNRRVGGTRTTRSRATR